MTQKDYKSYYIFSGILISAVFLTDSLSPAENTVVALKVSGFVVSALIVFIGINANYKANGGEQGKEFIGRSAALMVPIGTRLMVFYIIALFVFGLVLGIFQMSPEIGKSPLLTEVSSALILAVSFWRANKHLRYINQG